jgi:hypothetical protein
MRFYAFFTSEVEGRKWSASRPGYFSSGGLPVTLSTKTSWKAAADFGVSEKRKHMSPSGIGKYV